MLFFSFSFLLSAVSVAPLEFFHLLIRFAICLEFSKTQLIHLFNLCPIEGLLFWHKKGDRKNNFPYFFVFLFLFFLFTFPISSCGWFFCSFRLWDYLFPLLFSFPDPKNHSFPASDFNTFTISSIFHAWRINMFLFSFFLTRNQKPCHESYTAVYKQSPKKTTNHQFQEQSVYLPSQWF